MRLSNSIDTMIPVVTGLALLLAASAAPAMSEDELMYAAKCKPEGEQGQQCADARRETVKFAEHCKMEGEQAANCERARQVVESRKLKEQPGIAGSEDADKGAGRTAAATAEGSAKASGITDEERETFKYTMHCKPEGDHAQKCMDMREKVSKYAAGCKEEGAEGERCHMARKVAEAIK